MLEIIKSDDGIIKGVCEWWLVDSHGNFDKFGEFVWINEVLIAPQYRNNGVLKEFAKNIIQEAPRAKFGYFWRQEKYPDRKVRLYHKYRWLKLVYKEV